ncbi:LacI family DNA-binding transcriptional regulator [Bifidobacterium oedipodis]|uniref:LacI family transcriptional regulator n=1 Tax=Bifidobacterium oedipodis TaxID=2675322 RepID=A0A7Y0ER59_9BIFI|nr:LacI family DNA-binding transcriptional regulator [Bifidobacterium sp. DSM 109957]NMM94925.1 LacI family transcriptional regulator [Bifidobacterium sp. DSM 109957]
MVGIKEVAQRAGVSISTVSYAMSGKRPVSAETKLRVRQAARELGYYPSDALHVLRGELTHVIAVSSPIGPDTDYANWSPFFFAVASKLRAHGYDVLLLAGEQQDMERVADAGLVDGILLLDVTVDDPRAAAATTSSVPMVSIGCPRHVQRLAAVDLDFEAMGRCAIDKLAELGHRNLLFVGSPVSAYLSKVNFLVRTRDAILSRARSLGMHVSFASTSDGGLEEMRRLADRMLSASSAITAVLGQCDPHALTNLSAVLHERGMSIPDDLSMIALGSFGYASAMGVRIDEIPMQPYATCGRAVDLLMEFIEGKRQRPADGLTELVPVQYLQRGSVGKTIAPVHRKTSK